MSTPKETETINDQGEREVTVETVDYRKPAGGNSTPKKENIEVIHEVHEDSKSATGGGGPVAAATAVVKNTIKSAKDAFSGSDNNTTK